jgi:hypothetical protein
MAGMAEIINTYNILVGNPEGKIILKWILSRMWAG